MATSSASTGQLPELQDWEYVKQGIALWLNNQPKAAEESFKNRESSVHIVAGHTFISFMNAIISWETDKMNEAQALLRELEKKCAGDIGWLRTMRTKLFGSGGGAESQKSLAATLEEQIILADTQLCLAILVSLSQDIGGFVKGGWLLRKAWKVYQHTYGQIYQLYNRLVLTVPEEKAAGPQAPIRHKLDGTGRCGGGGPRLELGTPSSVEWTVPNSVLQTPDGIDDNEIHLAIVRPSTEDLRREISKSRTQFFTQTTDQISTTTVDNPPPDGTATGGDLSSGSTTTTGGSCASVKKSFTTQFEGIDLNQSSSGNDSSVVSSRRGSNACRESTAAEMAAKTCRENLRLEFEGFSTKLHGRNGLNGFRPRPPPEPVVGDGVGGGSQSGYEDRPIDPDDVRRLMGAVSFGYGVFQLSISLLPPSLLKLISFLGFEGDRAMGVACLMHSRISTDMRAPLSTLGLLWYYTIVTPFFALDGSNLHHEICSAQVLINESNDQFSKSSLFLFFRGRVERLKSNIKEAIQAYEVSYRSSAQREIKLLCLHEIGWCRLIQLDYGKAMKNFKELRRCSLFSKSFYAYLTVICQGAHGYFDELIRWRTEITDLLSRSSQKESQIEKYIARRCSKIPRADDEQEKFDCLYWRLLVYEMLFMWNALNSCNEPTLQVIVQDCGKPLEELNEPSIGLARLILGAGLVCLKRHEEAIQAFRECIAARADEIQQDVHISAFAHYELAMLLLRREEDDEEDEARTEAKQLLVYAQLNFKSFDFDNRINVRIHSVLKKLN